MLSGSKFWKEVYITLFVLLLFSTILSAQSELIRFFSSIAGERNFVVDAVMRFHVYDKEKMAYSDFEMRIFVAVRDMEDFYIRVEKPDIISGITFVYYADSNRIYSGYGDKFYMDSLEMPGDFIVKTAKEALDVLSSPFFIYRKKGEKGGEVIYTFFLSSAMFLRKLGIEPISISVRFAGYDLKDITIYGEKDEYVKFILKKFSAGTDVDKYFASIGS